MVRLSAIIWALCCLLLCSQAFAQEMKAGALAGRLLTKSGAPLNGALVFFFNERSGPPPAPEKYWRVPDELAETDNEGRFVAAVPPGTYYLGAIKRMGGKEVGPPLEGDLFFTNVDAKGFAKRYIVGSGRIDVGTIAEAVPYDPVVASKRDGISAIEGIVQTSDGQPMKGASVFAFMSPGMIGKPVFVSEKTGADGKFLLRVFGGGTFYLKARENYGGGPPKVGSMIGTYGEEVPLPVPVNLGEVTKGIRVKVNRFAGQGPGNR